MFGFILELLNGEGPQAFFDLSKGNRQATAAQKERKHLTHKRNHASRCDHHRLAKEATKGHPRWQCDGCRHKFTSCKAMKRHQCPLAKGASRGVVVNLNKGKSTIRPTPNKLATIPPPIPSSSSTPPATAGLQEVKKKRPRAPSSSQNADLACHPWDTMDQAFHSSTQSFGDTST
jgi:hypothetical protein